MMKIRSLSFKIVLIISVIEIVAILVLVTYFISVTKQNIKQNTEDQLFLETEYLSTEIEILINSAFNVLANENDNFLMLDAQNKLDKEIAIKIVETILKEDSNIVGMCLIFHPNSFCKEDTSFSQLMDRGFFIPYLYNTPNNSVGIEKLIDF